MPTSCPDETDLAELARGGPSDARRGELERHIDECDTCARVVADLLRVFGSIDRVDSSRRPVEHDDSGEPTLVEQSDGSTSARRSTLSLPEGAKLGRYVVLKKVGAGGMGVVYAAYDPELDRKVALKLLQPDELLDRGEDTLSQRNRRLLREAQAMARLHHPHVVTVHDVGTFEDRVFLAMEFVAGGTLREWSGVRQRSWRETLTIFRRAGEGLAAAHAAGLVHRDFKPDNVLLGDDGRVVVTDLGLARPTGDGCMPMSAVEAIEAIETSESSAWDHTLTRTGALVGTPAYMSPEQLRGERAEAASDQFSFCVTLYEALYGERPFAGKGLGALVASVLDGRVQPAPARSRVPRWLRRVLLRGLAVDPTRRFPEMSTLLAALRPPSRPLQIGVGALALGGFGLAASFALPSRTPSTYCERAEDHLRSVWDADVAAAVQAAFDRTSLPFAAETGTNVVARVDAYARQWAALQVEACRAESAAEEALGLTALRMACLATRRDALQALAAVLQEADATTVMRAPDMLDALPPLTSCEDTGVLASGPLPPPPALSTEVETIRGLLARAAVMSSAGKPQAASEHADDALRRAQAIAYRPVHAEAMLRAATSREEAGELDAAEAAAHDALVLALSSHHMVVAAEACHQLASIAVVRSQPQPHAERWVALGRAALEQTSGTAPLVRAQLQNILGTAQRRHGRIEESVETLHEALAIFATHFGDDDFRLAPPLTNLGLSLARLGRHDEAGRHLERARELFARKYGRSHLGYASTLQNLGASYYMQGAYEHALDLYAESLTGVEAALGPHHPSVGVIAYSVASALLMLGRYDEALTMADRSHAIGKEAHGERSVSVANDWSLIGEIHTRAGSFDAAETALRHALRTIEAAAPEERRLHAFYRSQLGTTLARAGLLEEGERLLTGALEEQEALLGPTDEYVAETLGWLAELHLDGNRDPQRARPLAERSLAIYDEVPTGPQVRAEARFRLARVLATADSPSARSLELAEEAAQMLRRVSGNPAQLAAVEAWLRDPSVP